MKEKIQIWIIRILFGLAILGLLTIMIMDIYLWLKRYYLSPYLAIIIMSLTFVLFLIVLCYLTINYENNGEKMKCQ